MASLLDFDGIGRLALGFKNLEETRRRNDIDEGQLQNEQGRLALATQQAQHATVYRAFDEVDKLAGTPAFSTPQQQAKLRFLQAKMLKDGLGVDFPVPSEEEVLGNMDAFTRNVKLMRGGGTPEEKQEAFHQLAIGSPDFGHKLLTTIKQSNELSVQNEELLAKLDLHKAKLQAMAQKSSRVALQQGLFSEHMGSLAQTISLVDHPKFKEHANKMFGLSEQARQVYLKANPQFEKEFTQAMQPHLEKIGAVGPEFEQALGEDVRPRALAALDQEIDARMQAKNEAIERDGVAPVELGEEIAGLEVVRKARTIQHAWMRDPFNKAKHTAMLKAQQDIRIVSDVAGKTMTGIQNERMGLLQHKFDAGQQEKLASDHAFEVFHQKIKEGHGEDDAAVLAGKAVAEKYPNVPYGAKDLKTHKPLVEVKNIQTQEKAEAKTVGEGFGGQYIALQKADMDSRSKIAKYDRMEQLLVGMQTGKLEPAKTVVQAVAESLGFSVDKSLPSKQAFQALSGEIALSLRNPAGGAGMPGALSDKDLAFLQSMTPDLAKTTEGNRLIIETARKLGKRDQDVAKMAREYRKKHGQLDEGFFDRLDEHSKADTLFQSKATQQGKAAQPQAQQFIETRTTKDGRKLGKTADGKIVEIK